MAWTIYCHTLVTDGRRYVGITSQTMERRWASHVTKAKYSKNGRWHFPNAIRKYGPQAFSHEVLEVCHSLEVANLAEECWIEIFETRDPSKGFNLAKGGLHIPHPIRRNPWDRPEYRAKCSEASRKRWEDPTLRAVMTAASKDNWSQEDLRERQSRTMEEYFADPEARKRNSAAQVGRVLSAEHKSKLSAISKAMWSEPETRQKCSPSLNGSVQKVKEAARASWASPEGRAKHMAVFQRPEVKARMKQKKTHCRRGHDLSESSIPNGPGGKRCCGLCRRLRESQPSNVG